MGKFDSGLQSRNDTTTAELIEALQTPKKEKDPAAKTRSLAQVAPTKKDGRENKTKRVELLLKPSTYEALKELAAEEERSINSLISRILEAHLSKGNN